MSDESPRAVEMMHRVERRLDALGGPTSSAIALVIAEELERLRADLSTECEGRYAERVHSHTRPGHGRVR